MSSHYSDEKNSSSMTSESDFRLFKQKVREFVHPTRPKINPQTRKMDRKFDLPITTNLFELKFKSDNFKFILFSIEILPEIADDNYSLRRTIYSKINAFLPPCFKKVVWAGKNCFVIIDDNYKKDYENFQIKIEIESIPYNLKFYKVRDISFKNGNDFNGKNQKNKSIIENIIRNIIMANPKIIKFQDRTIFEINPDNIINTNNQQYFYSGFITSVNITESGLYMLVNNVNKLITGKTALRKMIEIRKKLKEQNWNERDIHNEIREYFKSHKTVLTVYGSMRSYRIQEINFDKNPINTNISYKNKEGTKIDISLSNYYKIQYHIEIKDKNQPLIVAENNFQKNQISNNKYYNIYLIPELVYITGLEEENKNDRRRNMMPNRIKNPDDKMRKIKGIFNLLNSENHKVIKNNKGEEIKLKSPKELSEEWGIKLGSNLTFQGTIFPQPKLIFKGKDVYPENGRYRSGNPNKSLKITNSNIFFVYDKQDKNNNHRKLFTEIMKIAREKSFEFSPDFHPNNVKEFSIETTNNWEDIKKDLLKINNSENIFGIIFCSPRLEKMYNDLKYFYNKQLNIPTQHAVTKKLLDGKRGRTMMYNLVDQINVKNGGENFYIDFKKEEVIKSGQVFMIIGLDSKRVNGNIYYSMTSSKNFKLTNFFTQECSCEDRTQPRNQTLMKMFDNSIAKIMENCPHCPNYIIIYRQGGNDFRNKMLTVNELGNFQEVLNDYRKKNKSKDDSHNFTNTKLYYICCNLKSDLKFFETKSNNGYNSFEYGNPKSGLVVDDKVTQPDKFEFYIQPQLVNQGSATPCHYQVMHYDKSDNEENDLKIENLEKLSFYLSYYYWTWSGAIRVPSQLKMSSTAMDFHRKIYGEDNCVFDRPIYI